MHAWRAADFGESPLRALSTLTDLLTHDIAILDDAAVGSRAARRIAGRDRGRCRTVSCSTTGRSPPSWSTRGAGGDLEMSMLLPVEGVPGVRDPLAGSRGGAAGYTRDQATGRVRATAPLTGRPMIVDFNEGAADVVAERTGVSAERHAVDRRDHRAPSAAAARAGRAREELHAHARMQQHFRPTVTDPGYDVLTENRYFVAGGRGRMGGAVVLGERLEVGRGPAGRFRCCSRRRCCRCRCSCGSTKAIATGWRAPRVVDELDCFVVRFEPIRQNERALSRHRLDRQEDLRRACACRRSRTGCRRRSCRTTKRSTTAGRSSATVRSSSSAA